MKEYLISQHMLADVPSPAQGEAMWQPEGIKDLPPATLARCVLMLATCTDHGRFVAAWPLGVIQDWNAMVENWTPAMMSSFTLHESAERYLRYRLHKVANSRASVQEWMEKRRAQRQRRVEKNDE